MPKAEVSAEPRGLGWVLGSGSHFPDSHTTLPLASLPDLLQAFAFSEVHEQHGPAQASVFVVVVFNLGLIAKQKSQQT